MSHSLLTADRRTHGKIIAIAFTGVAALVAATFHSAPPSRSTAATQASAPVGVVKAAKPTATATRYYTVIR